MLFSNDQLNCRRALTKTVPSDLASHLWADQCPDLERYQEIFPQAPLPFVPQDSNAVKSAGGYEVFIEQEQAIPTRPNNWHDYFNALSWQLFPRTKMALHRSQCAHPDHTSHNKRSPQQNGVTLFDENGVIICTTLPWVETSLRQHNWQDLFIIKRQELISHSRLFVLGHALWEKARNPHIGLTAKWQLLKMSDEELNHKDCLTRCDERIAQSMPITPKQLGNLPLLGWPGTCAANEDPHFYDNTDYFRPLRQK